MSHDRNQSILYKVTSPQMPANRLLISREELDALLADADPYKRWIDKKSGRAIQEPWPRLAKVHRRIATLLARIDTPPYLHSAKKGRSYISNAAAHSIDDGCVKIDVRRFYPSARAQAVYHFFFDRMACDGDVAGMLAKLLTVDGHLPTGSSASPIVSYFAYEDLFNELAVLAEARSSKMTVYVDDIVFTGVGATRRLLFEAKKAIGKRHLHGHKTKLFRPGQPRVITGVVVTNRGLRLPNRRQVLIAEDQKLFDELPLGREKLTVARRLTGRLFEASQIDASWRARAEAMAAQREDIQRKIAR